ncbi:MAG: hypothetical protein V1867_08215 [Candidatus Falkowbacteria bacterium]
MSRQYHENLKIKENIIVFIVMFFSALYSYNVIMVLAEEIATGDAEVTETESSINQNIIDGGLSDAQDSAAAADDPADPDNGNQTDNNGNIEIIELDGAEAVDDATDTTGINGTEDNTGTSTIATGEAIIEAIAENIVNSNGLEADCGAECPDTASGTTSVDNLNAATTTNDVLLNGDSGGNTIASSSGDALITTGDVGIINIILNYINNNFFGPGKEYFINIFNHVMGAIDLSGFNGEETAVEESGACDVIDCYVTINNDNSASTDNNIVIDANTGDNIIATSTGEGRIETGDIEIVNDLVNIANLNVAGNDWFFAVVNIFGELKGDIILPGPGNAASTSADEAATTTEVIAQTPELEAESAGIILANTDAADLLNNIDINASTGDNTTEGGGEITTGEAVVESHVFNLINYSVTGNAWKFARVNIFGNWDGFITGLPAGYDYLEDEYGITIYNDILSDPEFYSAYAQMIVGNTNLASTTNNIEINASTGNNSILHSDGGSIATGDINIQNSLLNFINANFTGNSWEFSMVNVFGDWQGNLAFGLPDLWVTEANDAAGPVRRGDYINYTFLFGNKGDGLATGVTLSDDYDENYVWSEAGAGIVAWPLSDLPPNTQGSLSYAVRVRDDISAGHHNADNTVAISSFGNDRDPGDNSAGGTVVVDGGNAAAAGGAGNSLSSRTDADNRMGNTSPALVVVKTNDAADVVRPGDVVNYTITIRNPGGTPMEDVLVLDILSGEEGKVEVNRELWELGAVLDREEVSIGYSLEITSNIRSGVYANEVTVEGYDAAKDDFVAVVASTKIKVENPDWFGFRPLLEIGLSGGADYANPGDTVTYKAVITNNGVKTAKGVILSGSLGDGLTFLDGGGIINNWNLGDMVPGQFRKVFFTVEADKTAEPGLYLIEFEVKSDNSGTAETARDRSSLEIKTVAVAGLSSEEVAVPQPVAVAPAISRLGFLDDIVGQPEKALAAGYAGETATELDQTFYPGENDFAFLDNSGRIGNKIDLAPARLAMKLLIALSVIFVILTIILTIKERSLNNEEIPEVVNLKKTRPLRLRKSFAGKN